MASSAWVSRPRKPSDSSCPHHGLEWGDSPAVLLTCFPLDVYKLTSELLGEGAYAKVQGAVSLQTGKEYAVKVSVPRGLHLYFANLSFLACPKPNKLFIVQHGSSERRGWRECIPVFTGLKSGLFYSVAL